MIFLDVSRAFNKVFHEGLLHKLRQMGIEGPLLNWLQSYLSNRRQRVTLNGKCSDWGCPEAGVPQGSILGPLFFLIMLQNLLSNSREAALHLENKIKTLKISTVKGEDISKVVSHSFLLAIFFC